MPDLETQTNLSRFAQAATERLQRMDPELSAILENEFRRQANVLSMVASASIADPSALTVIRSRCPLEVLSPAIAQKARRCPFCDQDGCTASTS